MKANIRLPWFTKLQSINQRFRTCVASPSYGRVEFTKQLLGFYRCIGMIDTTLVKIRCRYKDTNTLGGSMVGVNLFSINNNVVVDHNGFFIYIDPITLFRPIFRLTFMLNVRNILLNIVNPTKHCYGSE